MTRYVQSVGTRTSTRQDPADTRHSRNTVAGVVLLMAAVIAAAFTWWLGTSQSVAGNVAGSPVSTGRSTASTFSTPTWCRAQHRMGSPWWVPS
jgi:hypothetical protein